MKTILWQSLAVLLLSYSDAVFAQHGDSVAVQGKILYEQHCLACHQADGSGVPGLAPPLSNGVFVKGEKKRLSAIILRGLEGVEINGEYYANPMPAFDYLSDEDIAKVLTYVRSNFKNEEGPVSAAEVKEARSEDNEIKK